MRGTQTVTALLSAGADPNGQGARPEVEIKDTYRWPLFARTSEDIVPMLLAAGASLERQHGSLGMFAHYGKTDLVRLLLEHGADPNEVVPGSPGAPSAASSWGRVEVVKLLLAHGARDVTFALACASAAPLEFSVEPEPGYLAFERSLIARLLVEAGADPAGIVDMGFGATATTALHRVALRGTTEIFAALLSKGPLNLNVLDQDGRTPLMLAAGRPSFALVEAFLAAGADAALHHQKGWAAYDYAKNAHAGDDRTKILAKLGELGFGPAKKPESAIKAGPPERRIGARVRHSKFGEGVVTGLTGSGPTLKATIAFGTESKTLIADFVEWLSSS